jgi:prohibitin 2
MAFGKEFRAAVEAKQVAQQEVEKARFIVQRAKQEKRTVIRRAMGEAESALLIGQAIAQNPNFLRLRRLEAIREIADILSTSKNRIYLPADGLLLPSISTIEDESSPQSILNEDLWSTLLSDANKMTLSQEPE